MRGDDLEGETRRKERERERERKTLCVFESDSFPVPSVCVCVLFIHFPVVVVFISFLEEKGKSSSGRRLGRNETASTYWGRRTNKNAGNAAV